MLVLSLEFKNREVQEFRFLTKIDEHCFDLTADSQEAYVFYDEGELLQVKNDVVRVLNRIALPGTDFDENAEYTKAAVRQIRSYLNMRGSRFDIQFVIDELVRKPAGKIAFCIRSDALS